MIMANKVSYLSSMYFAYKLSCYSRLYSSLIVNNSFLESHANS